MIYALLLTVVYAMGEGDADRALESHVKTFRNVFSEEEMHVTKTRSGTLRVYFPKPTDAILGKLAKVPKDAILEVYELRVNRAQCGASGWRELQRFQNTTFLNVSHQPDFEQGLAELISKLPQMKDLVLENMKINQGTVNSIGKCKKLAFLAAYDIDFGCTSLLPLAELTSCNQMSLISSGLTSDRFNFLSSLDQLEWLNVVDNPIDSSFFDILLRSDAPSQDICVSRKYFTKSEMELIDKKCGPKRIVTFEDTDLHHMP